MVVIHRSVFAVLAILVFVGCSERGPEVEPAGVDKSGKTAALEKGAALLQGQAPLNAMDVYLVGFHPLKNEPSHQMEAHHFCHQVNEDFAQCALFDGNTDNANLNGIEYIISESLFETLPEEEKAYWHPHNYEILSGQLTAPGIPSVAEMELMEGKMNSYGKTWQPVDHGLLMMFDPAHFGQCRARLTIDHSAVMLKSVGLLLHAIHQNDPNPRKGIVVQFTDRV